MSVLVYRLLLTCLHVGKIGRGGGGGREREGKERKKWELEVHDTNHHVVPKSMQLQTVLFRPGYMTRVQ